MQHYYTAPLLKAYNYIGTLYRQMYRLYIAPQLIDHVEDQETLKAFNLRSNMAKLVFKSTISGPVWMKNCRLKVEVKEKLVVRQEKETLIIIQIT